MKQHSPGGFEGFDPPQESWLTPQWKLEKHTGGSKWTPQESRALLKRHCGSYWWFIFQC